MKLITKGIADKAQKQYAKGNDLEGQKIVAKFFCPWNNWKWYLLNQDPKDPDYLWGIVKGHEIEIGSFNLSELESVTGQWGLKIERDMYCDSLLKMTAKECWDALQEGKHL